MQLRAGSRVGNWVLDHRLGKGGNATVWSASAAGGDSVAIKIPSTMRPESEVYRRFASEVELMRRLRGRPGVQQLVASELPGEGGTRLAWYASPIGQPMYEALEGATLRSVVEAVAEVAGTLAILSGEGIWHRDIKPSNVLRTGGDWCVADFGLAVFPGKEAITASGTKLGPMFYLAPEMLHHDSSVDPGPADVYSLAKVLWVLATGMRFPIPGQHDPDQSSQRIGTYVSDEGVRPLDRLVARATHFEPTARPTMRELQAELEAWVYPEAASPGTAPPMDELRERVVDIITPVLSAREASDLDRRNREKTLTGFGACLDPLAELLEEVIPTLVQRSRSGSRDRKTHTLSTRVPVLDGAALNPPRLQVDLHLEGESGPTLSVHLRAYIEYARGDSAAVQHDLASERSEFRLGEPSEANVRQKITNLVLSRREDIVRTFASDLEDWGRRREAPAF